MAPICYALLKPITAGSASRSTVYFRAPGAPAFREFEQHIAEAKRGANAPAHLVTIGAVTSAIRVAQTFTALADAEIAELDLRDLFALVRSIDDFAAAIRGRASGARSR